MVTTKRTLCESEINKPPQKTKKSAFMYVTWINDSKTRFSEQNKLMKFVCDAAKPATESLTGLLEFLNKLNKLCDVTIMERRLTVFHILPGPEKNACWYYSIGEFWFITLRQR